MTNKNFISRLKKLEQPLNGFAMKLTGNRNAANDLLQETSYRAFKARERFKVGTNFKAWVTTIMYNCFINDYRKRTTRNKVMYSVGDFNSIANRVIDKNSAYNSMMMKELLQIINQLPEIYRVPFQMFYKGYSYIEIGEKFELPLGTVKSRIFNARKQLKAAIRAKYNEEHVLAA